MDLAGLAITALATWELVEIWHHSGLTAGLRARAQCWDDWKGELLGCPFCLSVWVAAALVLLAEVPGATWIAPRAALALAGARLANLGNDLAHAHCRTPRADRLGPLNSYSSPEEDSPP